MSYLSITADMLMIAASTGAAIYCLILSRRLSRLTSFDKGIGGAIAVLSAQVDEMKSALGEARSGSDDAGNHLQDLIRQARDISGELELMIAACHDFAEQAIMVQGTPSTTRPRDDQALSPIPEPGVSGQLDSADAEPDLAMVVAPAAATPSPVQAQQEATMPIFGSRRAAAAQPVFVRHGQV
ncbi:DUF6468 domain-containing protein [Roseicyclus sp.]|uniref:DUF6468 domain-containing protein n=1 Tax=Roseicyclus sp. TaxID=1914329 RepID=UPI003F6A71DE